MNGLCKRAKTRKKKDAKCSYIYPSQHTLISSIYIIYFISSFCGTLSFKYNTGHLLLASSWLLGCCYILQHLNPLSAFISLIPFHPLFLPLVCLCVCFIFTSLFNFYIHSFIFHCFYDLLSITHTLHICIYICRTRRLVSSHMILFISSHMKQALSLAESAMTGVSVLAFIHHGKSNPLLAVQVISISIFLSLLQHLFLKE